MYELADEKLSAQFLKSQKSIIISTEISKLQSIT